MPDVAPALWLLPAVLAWWMVRALNSIRLDVSRVGEDEAATADRSAEPVRLSPAANDGCDGRTGHL